VALNLALPFLKILAFMFLLAVLGTSHCLMFFPLINNCPSARCAYAANSVGKDVDVFAIGAVSRNHIYTHQPNIVNIISSQS
jgi:hypothetical protein